MKRKVRITIWRLNMQPILTRAKELLSRSYGEIQMQGFNDICKKLNEVITEERDIAIGNLNVHIKSIFSRKTTLNKAIENIILRKSTKER